MSVRGTPSWMGPEELGVEAAMLLLSVHQVPWHNEQLMRK